MLCYVQRFDFVASNGTEKNKSHQFLIDRKFQPNGSVEEVKQEIINYNINTNR